MAWNFLDFKKGMFWVVFGVLIFAVSLTAQAPKSPAPVQSASEVGRYVFWSADLKDYAWFGFLDTKRGRVWIYVGDSSRTWSYRDLNADARGQVAIDNLDHFLRRWKGLKDGLLKELGDTAKVRKEYEKLKKTFDDMTEREIQRIREHEK
ncbi:MAG TPA: hypothetical protein VNL73_02505 [Verrucomicrobiae bacterium]|nr:hypothetical protein [Verrucomicrobiae bacterium]